MSTNLEYRTRERQRKRESRRQASEDQREKGDRGQPRPQGFSLKKWPGDEVGQRSRARDKKQKRRYFFVGRTTRKFCSGGDKMRNATGHQCKVKISCTEKKGTRTRTKFPPKKRVTKKFLKVSLCNLAKQRQKMYKKVCCT